MHTPIVPAAYMMPSTGALMDPQYLRSVVADASEYAHASRTEQPSWPPFLIEAASRLRAAVVRGVARLAADK